MEEGSAMEKRIDFTQVIWEITKLLQEAESLEDALRSALKQVVTAVGAEAGTIWFYNKRGDGNIYPSFWIGGADLTGMSLRSGEGIAGAVVETGNRRYITTPSMLACFLSVVICVIFALIINAIALRKINHLSLTNVSGN